MSSHTNRDPVTWNCLDCGATREEIDDNLFPQCEKVEGPHRLAIIAVRREKMTRGHMAQMYERSAQGHEEAAVHCSKEARKLRQEERELTASLDYLRGDPGEKPLPLAEAIARMW